MSTIYGANGNVYAAHGDEHPTCPGCYQQHNSSIVGQIFIDGSPLDVHKCGCGRAYAGTQGGISTLIAEVEQSNPDSVVTFTVNSAGSPLSTSTMYDPLQDQTIKTIENLERTQRELLDVVQNLTYKIEDIIEQNHKLNEKLVSDPLIGYRKKVSEFNLE